MNFAQISILLVTASLFGVIAKFLKQPLLVGFLFSGFLLSYFGFLGDHEMLDSLGKIGVALLLFLIGMEMNLADLKNVGKVAIATGLGQIVFTMLISFLIALGLGFSFISAIYIAAALSFSSTIIIVKLLSQKGDINSLYGKISVGFLLVQDFVAIIILLFLAGLKEGNTSLVTVFLVLVKSVGLFGLVWYLSKDLLPKIFTRIVGNSQELLFIISIAWALGIASLVGGPLNLSFEIGGFLAGLALSNLPDHIGISSKTKSLRDFFLTIFFVTLGGQLVISGAGQILPLALLFSLIVLIGNPLIVMFILGLMGHKSRTSFLASVAVAQISEFSFILMAMGKSLGHVSQSELSLIILVGAITMTGSTYLILGSEKVYYKLRNILKIFERKKTRESVFAREIDLKDHVVLIGCDKIGSSLIPFFKKHNYQLVVVDFDPNVFSRLSSENINVLLGDITDEDIIALTRMDKAKLVLSTIPNLEENYYIINTLKKIHNRPAFIASSNNKFETLRLYEEGVDYVLNPDIITGEFLRHTFKNYGLNQLKITKMGKAHFNRLMYLKSYKNVQ